MTPRPTPRLPDTVQYLLGIDGGGTSTRVRLQHLHGQILGEGKAGASGLMQGAAQAWRNIALAIARAVQASGLSGPSAPRPDNCALGLGLAGANNPLWRAQFLATNPGYAALALDSDAFTALLGAHGGDPGAMVIAGTGSIALSLHADGRRTVAGGWGFPSGDEGSGSALGLQAMNLAQQAMDGRCAPSALTDAVQQATGGGPTAMLAWCGAAGQFEYASLAPLVFDCEGRDPAAARLLATAVAAMAQLVVALDPAGSLPLAISGSIGQRLAPRLPHAMQRQVVSAQGDAMDGAIALCFL